MNLEHDVEKSRNRVEMRARKTENLAQVALTLTQSSIPNTSENKTRPPLSLCFRTHDARTKEMSPMNSPREITIENLGSSTRSLLIDETESP